MIGGTLRLIGGTGRWVPPFLVALVWVLFIAASPGSTVDNHVGTFPGLLMFALWLTIAIGSLDDDPHRDLLAAAAGSTGRLHLERAVATGAAGMIVVAVTSFVSTAVGIEDDKKVLIGFGVGLSLGAAAVLIGVGFGTWLHRPILYHRGAAPLLGVGATIGVILFPPLQAALRNVIDGESVLAPLVLLAGAAWAAVSVAGAARVAQLLAR